MLSSIKHFFIRGFSSGKPFSRIKFFFFKEKSKEPDKMVSKVSFGLELERSGRLSASPGETSEDSEHSGQT